MAGTSFRDRSRGSAFANGAAGTRQIGVYDAIRRHWGFVLAPVVLLCVIAVAVAAKRPPNYHAEARLNVGGFNITSQEVPGFVGGAIQLATTYSRAVYAPVVLKQVQKKVHKSRAEVMSELSASPVADSPIIRVDAESKDKAEAMAAANAAGQGIAGYATRLARSNPDSGRLLRAYRHAIREQRQARAKHGPNSVQMDLATLRVRTLAGLYGQSVGGQASSNVVQMLAPALSASSDRGSFLQRLIAAAILGGLAIGALLAVLVARAQAEDEPPAGSRNGRRWVRAAPRPEPSSAESAASLHAE